MLDPIAHSAPSDCPDKITLCQNSKCPFNKSSNSCLCVCHLSLRQQVNNVHPTSTPNIIKFRTRIQVIHRLTVLHRRVVVPRWLRRPRHRAASWQHQVAIRHNRHRTCMATRWYRTRKPVLVDIRRICHRTVRHNHSIHKVSVHRVTCMIRDNFEVCN